MRPGELVKVKHSSSLTYLGVVMKYEPEVYGGSYIISSPKDRESWVSNTPVRGKALVMDPQEGSISWCDEINLTPVVST